MEEEQQEQQEQQFPQQYDSFFEQYQMDQVEQCFAGVHAYHQQHAQPQQRRRAASVSGTRRKRADAGVPRGPRSGTATQGSQQQLQPSEGDDEVPPMAAEQQSADSDAQQLHPPTEFQELAHKLQEVEQLLQCVTADHAAQRGAEAPAAEWRRRKESWFRQHREAAPANAAIVLSQQAAPPDESTCCVCQNTCRCTIR